MGCDIHIYPEYWSTKDLNRDGDPFAHSICGNYSVGRSYELFGIMAGVRGACSDVIVPPRGLPDVLNGEPPIGWDAEHDLTITVVPDGEIKNDSGWEEKYVAQSVVNSWGGTPRVYKSQTLKDGSKRETLLHPDYHSHSWLTLQELLEVRRRMIINQVKYNSDSYEIEKKDIKAYKKILKDVRDPEMLLKHNFGDFEYTSLNGLIGMLYFMEKSSPDIKTRIVFWFDN